jgi:hypothetical protein
MRAPTASETEDLDRCQWCSGQEADAAEADRIRQKRGATTDPDQEPPEYPDRRTSQPRPEARSPACHRHRGRVEESPTRLFTRNTRSAGF